MNWSGCRPRRRFSNGRSAICFSRPTPVSACAAPRDGSWPASRDATTDRTSTRSWRRAMPTPSGSRRRRWRTTGFRISGSTRSCRCSMRPPASIRSGSAEALRPPPGSRVSSSGHSSHASTPIRRRAASIRSRDGSHAAADAATSIAASADPDRARWRACFWIAISRSRLDRAIRGASPPGRIPSSSAGIRVGIRVPRLPLSTRMPASAARCSSCPSMV